MPSHYDNPEKQASSVINPVEPVIENGGASSIEQNVRQLDPEDRAEHDYMVYRDLINQGPVLSNKQFRRYINDRNKYAKEGRAVVWNSEYSPYVWRQNRMEQDAKVRGRGSWITQGRELRPHLEEINTVLGTNMGFLPWTNNEMCSDGECYIPAAPGGRSALTCVDGQDNQITLTQQDRQNLEAQYPKYQTPAVGPPQFESEWHRTVDMRAQKFIDETIAEATEEESTAARALMEKMRPFLGLTQNEGDNQNIQEKMIEYFEQNGMPFQLNWNESVLYSKLRHKVRIKQIRRLFNRGAATAFNDLDGDMQDTAYGMLNNFGGLFNYAPLMGALRTNNRNGTVQALRNINVFTSNREVRRRANDYADFLEQTGRYSNLNINSTTTVPTTSTTTVPTTSTTTVPTTSTTTVPVEESTTEESTTTVVPPEDLLVPPENLLG